MPLANLSIQVIPKVSTDKTYEVVDQAIAVIQRSGLKYIVGPMETTIEGELDELFEVAKETQRAVIDAGASGFLTMIKIDYSSKGVTMEEKVGKYRG